MPLQPPLKQSPAGEALTKGFEGFSLKAYLDGGGVPTIGWGHTQGVRLGQTITAEVAESFYQADTSWAVSIVNRLCNRATQNQFDAMVDFCFNVGEGHFGGSTLLKLHNAGDYAGAAAQFARWNKAAGEVEAGLVRRRAAEAELYGKAD